MGLGLVAFANAVCVSKSSQVLYEADERRPDLDYSVAAEAIGVNMNYVTTGSRSRLCVDARTELQEIFDGIAMWSFKQRLHPPPEQLGRMYASLLEQQFPSEDSANRHARVIAALTGTDL